MLETFKNFKISEIPEWIQDYINFIFKPRKIIDKIFEKENDEILRQFFFYFLIYSISFFFLSINTNYTDWIRAAVINLFGSIPVFVVFILSTKFFKKSYSQYKVAAFILGVQFISIPICNLLTITFLATENYTYRFICHFFISLTAIYLISFFGIALEKDRFKALKLSLSVYVVFNLMFFLFQRIDVDPYSNFSLNEMDPIFKEYKELVTPIENKGEIPTNRFISVINGKIQTSFAISNIITDSISTSNNQLCVEYLEAISKNIEHIQAQRKEMKFNRNKTAAVLWLDYLEAIQIEASLKVKNEEELMGLETKLISSVDTTGFKMSVYSMSTDIGKIISLQIPLKSYHNSTVQNHYNSSISSDVTEKIVFFFGYLLDYVVGDLILKEGESKPYKETFLETE